MLRDGMSVRPPCDGNPDRKQSKGCFTLSASVLENSVVPRTQYASCDRVVMNKCPAVDYLDLKQSRHYLLALLFKGTDIPTDMRSDRKN